MYGYGFYWSGRCSNDKRAASDLFSEQLHQACKQSGAGAQTQWNRDLVHFLLLWSTLQALLDRGVLPRFTLTANWLCSPHFINVDCRTVTRRLASSMLVLMLRIDPRAIMRVCGLCVKCDRATCLLSTHVCDLTRPCLEKWVSPGGSSNPCTLYHSEAVKSSLFSWKRAGWVWCCSGAIV